MRHGWTIWVLLVLVGCAARDPFEVVDNRDGAPERSVAAVAKIDPPTKTARPTPELDESKSMTLAQCVEFGLSSHPSTRSAWLAAQSAAANVGVQKSAFYPTVTFSADTSVSDSGSLEPRENAVGWGLTGRFSIAYLIFDGGARQARLEGAEAALAQADFRHQTTLMDVAFGVQEAWYVLQGAMWYQTAVEDLILQAEAQLRLATARFNVGLARKYDVVQAEAKLAETERLKVVAESQIRQARGQLARAMGLDPRTRVPVAKMSTEDLAPSVGAVDQFMAQAVERRPELGEARARVESALADAKVADAGRYPSISANASVAGSYDTRSDFAVPWSVGVGLTVPLYQGREVYYGKRRAEYAEKQAREELRNEVDQILFEVWAAHTQVIDSVASIAATRKVLDAAKASVALAEGNYKEGLGTIVEVFDAQAELANAWLNLVQARLDWFLAVARLERAAGLALGGGGE